MMLQRTLDKLAVAFSFIFSYLLVGFSAAVAVSLVLTRHQVVAGWYIQIPVFFLAGDTCFKILNSAFRGAVKRGLGGRPLTVWGCAIERRRRKLAAKRIQRPAHRSRRGWRHGGGVMTLSRGQCAAKKIPARCAGGAYFSTHKKEHTPDAQVCIAGCIARCITHTSAKTQQYQGIAAVTLGTDAHSDSRCESPNWAMQMRCTSDAEVHHFIASPVRSTKTRDAEVHRHMEVR